MTDQLENYYCAILFLLSIQETNINSLEIGDLDNESIWGYLELLDNLGLVDLSKTHAFIKPTGRVYLKTHLDKLEDRFIGFVKKRETDISKSVNVTEFMQLNFIKPNPKSKRTSNDRDFGVYFIKYLKSKDLIKYDENTLSHVNYWCTDGGENPEIKMWFHNLDKPLYVELKNQSDLVDLPREDLPITSPHKTQITLQINTNKEGTWLVRIFKKIIDNTVLTLITIIGTVVGTLLAIMIVNYFNHKGFKL